MTLTNDESVKIQEKEVTGHSAVFWCSVERAERNEVFQSENAATTVGREIYTRLDCRGSTVRFPAGAGNFSLRRIQNGSGAYPMGTRGSFPGGKAAGA
jgi:hypothetical protein